MKPRFYFRVIYNIHAAYHNSLTMKILFIPIIPWFYQENQFDLTVMFVIAIF